MLHVSSDLLILSLPLVITRSLRLSRIPKAIVACVFLLIIINICMAVSRLVAFILIDSPDVSIDRVASLDICQIMATCKPAIAVVIYALPTYWVLLPSLGHKRGDPNDIPQQHIVPWPVRKNSESPQVSTLPMLSTEGTRTSDHASTQHTVSQVETEV